MSLPPEILFKIFSSVTPTSLPTIACVCSQWRDVVASVLYTSIRHLTWKPKRVEKCLRCLAMQGASSAELVQHLDLRLWSVDKAFAVLLMDALNAVKRVHTLRLSMSETFSVHFEEALRERKIISDVIGDGLPQLYAKHFLPALESLELSNGHLPFQLAAWRPVKRVFSSMHMDLYTLRRLLPFLQRSKGPLSDIHLHLSGRDAGTASEALRFVAESLPYLRHIFFNFFVGKRSQPIRNTPDLLDELSNLFSLHSVELILSRHARYPDPYLDAHFAAVHALKATAVSLTHVVLDSISWQYLDGKWSPLPTDVRTHEWWLSQYGDASAAHAAMNKFWKGDTRRIPRLDEIGRCYPTSSSEEDAQGRWR